MANDRAAWADIETDIASGRFRALLLADNVTAKVTRHGVQLAQSSPGFGAVYMPTADCQRRIEKCQIEINCRQANIAHLRAMLAQVKAMQAEDEGTGRQENRV